jgi:hypothetical protein
MIERLEHLRSIVFVLLAVRTATATATTTATAKVETVFLKNNNFDHTTPS